MKAEIKADEKADDDHGVCALGLVACAPNT